MRVLAIIIALCALSSIAGELKVNRRLLEQKLKSAPTPELVARLKKTVVADYRAEEIPLKHAIQYLKQLTAKHDATGKGFNVLFKCAKKSQVREITMNMQNVPVSDLLYFICIQARLNFRIDKHAVIITDLKPKEKINRY